MLESNLVFSNKNAKIASNQIPLEMAFVLEQITMKSSSICNLNREKRQRKVKGSFMHQNLTLKQGVVKVTHDFFLNFIVK